MCFEYFCVSLQNNDENAANIVEISDVTGGGPELFHYQTGYLTIKGYQNGVYFLGIPNHEVRRHSKKWFCLPSPCARDWWTGRK